MNVDNDIHNSSISDGNSTVGVPVSVRDASCVVHNAVVQELRIGLLSPFKRGAWAVKRPSYISNTVRYRTVNHAQARPHHVKTSSWCPRQLNTWSSSPSQQWRRGGGSMKGGDGYSKQCCKSARKSGDRRWRGAVVRLWTQ